MIEGQPDSGNAGRKRVWLSWSSGKDSAWALHRLRADPTVEVTGLFTTVNEAFGRVAMHGVRRTVLESQARATGLPLRQIPIPWPCDNATYEARMTAFIASARAAAVSHFAFGDLFLEDVRAYRERQLQGTGMAALFPLWQHPTPTLAEDLCAAPVTAYISCLDPRALPARFAGRRYDRDLLAELPATVDPCGENGEFHTLVTDGPMFRHPLDVAMGETVERDGFVFTDFMLAGPES